MNLEATKDIKEAVLRYQQGDDSAFASIYQGLINARTHWVKVFNSVLRDEAESRSLVDKAIIEAIEAYNPAKSVGKFETWAWTVLHNRWKNKLQRRNSNSRTSIIEGERFQQDSIYQTSLDFILADEESDLHKIIYDPTERMPWEDLGAQDDVDLYRAELRLCCTSKDWEIIQCFLDDPEAEYSDIADKLGIETKRVDNVLFQVSQRVRAGKIAGNPYSASHARLFGLDNLVKTYLTSKSVKDLDKIFSICEPMLAEIAERYAPYQQPVYLYALALWTDVINRQSVARTLGRLKSKFRLAESNGEFKRASLTPFLDLGTKWNAQQFNSIWNQVHYNQTKQTAPEVPEAFKAEAKRYSIWFDSIRNGL